MFVVCSVCVTSVYVAGCVIMMCVSVCNVFFYAYTVCVCMVCRFGCVRWLGCVGSVCVGSVHPM